jgi:hypothetical protein
LESEKVLHKINKVIHKDWDLFSKLCTADNFRQNPQTKSLLPRWNPGPKKNARANLPSGLPKAAITCDGSMNPPNKPSRTRSADAFDIQSCQQRNAVRASEHKGDRVG